MNKKQMVILWVIGIVFCGVAYNQAFYQSSLRMLGTNRVVGSTTKFNPVVGIGVPVLIIGTLLIYTLRTKKKD